MKQEIRAGQEHLMTMINTHHERMMACLGKMEATDLKVNPEEMESESEHREVPQEMAAVRSLGTMKKRHWDPHLAAGHCGKPEELTQGDCGSWRKLAAACRKVPCHTRVAWHRRNIVREYIRAKVEQGILRVQTLRERVRTHREGRKEKKGLGGRRPRYLRKRDLKKLRQESMGNVNKTHMKTTGLEIVKRIARSAVGL
jgi:hypothetical protein